MDVPFFVPVMKRPQPARLKAHVPRHAKTAAFLGRRIMGGDLEPGVTLPNAALLARELKLSRPSLREAIKILAAKGLLSAAPRRGTIVRPRSDWNRLDHDVLSWEAEVAPTPRFIRDLFELRRMVEPEAAALAAVRATEAGQAEMLAAVEAMAVFEVKSEESIGADLAFHRAILTHSGNDFLATFAPAIEASLRIAILTQRKLGPLSAQFLPAHRAIYQAIRLHDPELARRESFAHLTQAEADAVGGLSSREQAADQSAEKAIAPQVA